EAFIDDGRRRGVVAPNLIVVFGHRANLLETSVAVISAVTSATSRHRQLIQNYYGLRSRGAGFSESAIKPPARPRMMVPTAPPAIVRATAPGTKTNGTSSTKYATAHDARVPIASAAKPESTPSKPYS